MDRIAIIGNGGGGKSTAARRLSKRFDIPCFSVDQAQWEPGWQRAPLERVAAWHAEVLAQERWIIDGWGAWDLIEARFLAADTILFVDFPLEVHLAWARRREEMSARGECRDEPTGCRYADIADLMTETLERVDRDYLPKLRDLLAAYGDKVSVFHTPVAFRAWVDQAVS